MLSIVVGLIYILTRSVFFFSTPWSEFVFVCVIDDSHSDWGEVESQCNFELYFLHGQGC
jgi:hypothetical protein